MHSFENNYLYIITSKSLNILSHLRKRMLKLRSRRLFKSSLKCGGGKVAGRVREGVGDIEWEMRPGGMLVQKREGGRGEGEGLIAVRVSTGSSWHDVSIGATSTFGELKRVVSMATGLEPREQRLLFKGKEREDSDHLHMVGVRDGDKVVLLEDPAIKERKLQLVMRSRSQVMGSSNCPAIIEV